MKKITLLLSILIYGCVSAQTYSWALAEGGYNEDRGFGIATDATGNVFVTGPFKSAATFGNINFTSSGVEDVFLAKYDSAGTLLWAKQFGGSSIDIGYDVATDAAGNCYLAGTFRQQATFGPFTLQSAQDYYDTFLLKTDPNGNVLWVRQGGGTGWDEAHGVVVSGNQVYVTGHYSGTATFGSVTVNAVGNEDAFIASYDLNGNVNWVSHGGGAQGESGRGIDADADGNAYVTGCFQGTNTFGQFTIVNPHNIYVDVFVVKVGPDGTILWARSGGAPGDDDQGRAIATDPAGNVYVAGELRGSGHFDSINFSINGIANMFVAKYDAQGNIQWMKNNGGQGGTYAYGIAASNAAVFATGLYHDSLQFGNTVLPEPTSNNIYLSEMDSETGSFVSAVNGGGLGNDAGRALAIGPDGSVYQTGDFEHSNSPFGQFILNSAGVHDVLVARLTPTTLAVKSEEKPVVSIAPIPATNEISISLPNSKENIKCTVYAASGRLVKMADCSDCNKLTINVSNLAAGIYFINTQSGSTVSTTKMIKI